MCTRRKAQLFSRHTAYVLQGPRADPLADQDSCFNLQVPCQSWQGSLPTMLGTVCAWSHGQINALLRRGVTGLPVCPKNARRHGDDVARQPCAGRRCCIRDRHQLRAREAAVRTLPLFGCTARDITVNQPSMAVRGQASANYLRVIRRSSRGAAVTVCSCVALRRIKCCHSSRICMSQCCDTSLCALKHALAMRLCDPVLCAGVAPD